MISCMVCTYVCDPALENRDLYNIYNAHIVHIVYNIHIQCTQYTGLMYTQQGRLNLHKIVGAQ